MPQPETLALRAATGIMAARRQKRGLSVQGVLIVIGGVFLAAMFLVLYVRATVAERRAEELQKELEELRRS